MNVIQHDKKHYRVSWDPVRISSIHSEYLVRWHVTHSISWQAGMTHPAFLRLRETTRARLIRMMESDVTWDWYKAVGGAHAPVMTTRAQQADKTLRSPLLIWFACRWRTASRYILNQKGNVPSKFGISWKPAIILSRIVSNQIRIERYCAQWQIMQGRITRWQLAKSARYTAYILISGKIYSVYLRIRQDIRCISWYIW